jgi:RNA polymerase sigma-70 factor (ECF subfamily)
MRSQIRSGDPDAFGALFDEHATAVYNHAFRLTGNWSTAEDVMALTFLEAWRLRTKIESEGGSLRPWLLGIATNTARNTQRARRRYEEALSRLPPLDAVPDFAQELVDRLEDARTIEVVNVALGGLRQVEREVVALCVWSGLDYAATAEALGIPVGTVRSRLARARKKLAKIAREERSKSEQEWAREQEQEQEQEPATELVRGDGQLKGGRAYVARQIPEETR